MPTNLIQIKRSLNTAVPASLANGELAFTANGDVLYIGSNSVIVPIGGKRTPGTLTANQNITVNSSLWIDVLNTTKLIIGAVGTTINISSINTTSNSTVLGAAANNELVTSWAIKNYVDNKTNVVSPPGSNTEIQFNDSGVANASAGLVFDKAANNLTVSNSISALILSARDLTLTGNLTVQGTLTTVDATNLQVKDSMIKLADQNTTTDTLSIGFYGTFGNSTVTQFTGIFRDSADGIIKSFTTEKEPTTTVDTSNNTYAAATIQTFLKSGGAGLTGLIANSSVINITANSTLSVALVANTLSLSTALPGTSGGTGLATIAAGSIIVGNSTNGFTALALGADGTILQVSGTSLVYSTLDGGTF